MIVLCSISSVLFLVERLGSERTCNLVLVFYCYVISDWVMQELDRFLNRAAV